MAPTEPNAAAADAADVEVTRMLEAMARGEQPASDALVDAVYQQLRSVARGLVRKLTPGQTLEPTALVHEAWLRVVADRRREWECRAHFFGAAARAMRHIMVDQARRRSSQKRGGDRRRSDVETDPAIEPPDDDVLMLNDLLHELQRVHPRKARIVELRYFAGLTVPAIATALEISTPTVDRDWRFARAWLQQRIRAEDR